MIRKTQTPYKTPRNPLRERNFASRAPIVKGHSHQAVSKSIWGTVRVKKTGPVWDKGCSDQAREDGLLGASQSSPNYC